MNIADYIFNCSAVILAVCTAIIFVLAIFPIKTSQKSILNIFRILIISLAVFSYFAEPGPSTDLYRHYIRIANFNQYSNENKVLVVWNFMIWIVGKTGHNGLLPSGCILIWGYLVGQILKDYLSKNKYTPCAVFLYFISLFSGCGIYYMISGIRNTLVTAIIAYAYYILRGKKNMTYYFFIAVSSFIHISALLLFIIIEVYERLIKENQKLSVLKTLVFAFSVTFLLNSDLMIRIINLIPGSYGRFLFDKWNSYTQYNNMDAVQNLFRMFWVAFFVIFTVIKLIKYRKIEFFDWLTLVTISLSPMTIFFERLPYMMGICSLTAVDQIFLNYKGIGKFILHITLYLVSCLLLFVLVYMMFAHVKFNGNSYHEFLAAIVD